MQVLYYYITLIWESYYPCWFPLTMSQRCGDMVSIYLLTWKSYRRKSSSCRWLDTLCRSCDVIVSQVKWHRVPSYNLWILLLSVGDVTLDDDDIFIVSNFWVRSFYVTIFFAQKAANHDIYRRFEAMQKILNLRKKGNFFKMNLISYVISQI